MRNSANSSGGVSNRRYAASIPRARNAASCMTGLRLCATGNPTTPKTGTGAVRFAPHRRWRARIACASDWPGAAAGQPAGGA